MDRATLAATDRDEDVMAVDKAVEDLIRQKVRAALTKSVHEGMIALPDEPDLWTLGCIGPGSALDGIEIELTPEIRKLEERIWKEEEGKVWSWIRTNHGHLLEAHEQEFKEWQKKNTGCLSVVIGEALFIALLVRLSV
ncbi:MAG: hypothetical protein NTX23_03015 [Candidatus Bipolaricaulota bacterium]|nr:hypothetical protein [Candidatus Bipolaricaulota bacterium]